MYEILREAVAFAGTITIFTGAITVIVKTPIGQFLMRSIKHEARELMLAAAKEANGPLEGKASILEDKQHEIFEKIYDLNDYTRHHLGPNGDTPPLYTRIEALERKAKSQD